MTQFGLLAIGFLAQLFFSARILVQWVLSERARRVVSPTIFWVLSLAGSFLLCAYGWLRDDFSIVLGQFISYYVYLWNLNEKGVWKRLHPIVRGTFLLIPVVAVAFTLQHPEVLIEHFFENEKVPLGLLIFGSAGQVIFTFRFLYQWFYSYRRNRSVLPAGFWIISLVGSSIIVTYGFIRWDLVLILGQSFGMVAYARNLYLWYRHPNPDTDEKE